MNHATKEPPPGPTDFQQPVEPPFRRPRSGPYASNRADLVLFFGIFSLFLCGPLGIIAWIMANSDLRKIRAGTLAPVKIGTLKAGRILGIIGTVMFGVVLALGVVAVKQGLEIADLGIKGIDGFMKSEPLPVHQMAFAGEWRGDRGTLIRIGRNGTGDFRSRHTTVTGGRVSISEDSLSIGLLGVAKTWHIDEQPHIKGGVWTMILEGEVFTRKGEGLMVDGRNWKRSPAARHVFMLAGIAS
jgi:hypothetical protein